MERLTWTCRADGYDDVRLREGVTVGDAICQLADYEDTGLEPREIIVISGKDVGKTVFLTCEEAEATLKKRGHNTYG